MVTGVNGIIGGNGRDTGRDSHCLEEMFQTAQSRVVSWIKTPVLFTDMFTDTIIIIIVILAYSRSKAHAHVTHCYCGPGTFHHMIKLVN